jgi:hypothetical protein
VIFRTVFVIKIIFKLNVLGFFYSLNNI